MVTRLTCWLAYRLHHLLHMPRYQQQILNWIMRLFLKFFVLPNAILLGNEKMIRDVVMTLKMIEDDEHNRNMVEMLVNAGVPLRFVVNWATPKIVRMMLNMGVKPNDPYEDFEQTALHAAVAKGDAGLEIARILLDRGADVNAVDEHGYTPLQRTLRLRYPILRMVKLLLSRGAEVDRVVNTSKKTPLLMAVTYNQPLSVVKVLVKHGANPIKERTLKGGQTVLHRASVHQRRDLVDYFLHLGMNVNVRSKSETNLISRKVIKSCKSDFFKFLMSRNAKMDKPVLRWMLSCSSNAIKDAEWKLRLYMLYAGMKSTRPFYQVCRRLRPDIAVDYALPMFEIIALREFMTNEVDLSNQIFLARRQQFKKYFLGCKEELQRMKDEKLHGEVTLLNLLTDHVTKVGRYLRNRIIAQALEEANFKKRYRTYSVYLEIILQHVKEQYRLKEMTAARLAQLQGFDPYHLCVTKIVSFLGPQDMRMFLSCFENDSKSYE